jgi:hypothetical protein
VSFNPVVPNSQTLSLSLFAICNWVKAYFKDFSTFFLTFWAKA